MTSRPPNSIFGALFDLLHHHKLGHHLSAICNALGIDPKDISKSDINVNDLTDLPTSYESIVSSETKNKNGVTYTPLSVASKVIDTLFNKNHFNILSKKIIDPSCGAGIFLLLTFQKIAPRNLSFETRSRILSESVFGVDIDSSAVLLTKALLLSELLFTENLNTIKLPNLDRNIIADDALLGNFLLFESSFDYVIGNPPYGISRDEKIGKDENIQLRARYNDALCGRVNKYLLFIWKGLDILRPDGTLAFIVPNAWLGIKEAHPIRQRLFHETSCTIEILPSKTFNDRSVEPVILTARKILDHSSDLTILSKDKSTSIPKSLWAKSPGLCIPTRWDTNREKICQKLISFPRLGSPQSPFIPRIAIQAYAAGRGTPAQTKAMQSERSFHSTEKKGADWIPYLEGKDIGRYLVNWSESYIHYGPWLSEMQPLTRFNGPRIVVREITGKEPYLLKAAFLEEEFIYNKSVLHILPEATVSRSSILALLAYLNSDIVSVWLTVFGRKCQRTVFPKIVLDDLREIPLPETLYKHESVLASLAEAQITGYTTERDAEINSIIYSLLEFDYEESPIIANL